MRSIPFTLLLLLLTVAVSLTAVLRISEGSLNRLFGSPATQVGENLYHFDTKDIHRIQLSGNGVKAECVFEKGTWRMEKPWQDRMDPRAADAILQFTLGTRVEEIIPEGKLDDAKAGLRDGTFGIRVENRKGEELARYYLGRKTEWIHLDAESGVETPTVFIRPFDSDREGYIYACTGDIHPIFTDGMRHLRDHHPFLFNPFALESIRIQSGEAKVQLTRADPKVQSWRITQPLELLTDPAAVKKLIEDLFKLRAIKVFDRSEVTLPAEGTNGRQRIALRHFDQAEEVVLEILPPATPDAETVFATVSDRPGTVFELQLKPLAPSLANKAPSDDDIIALAGLPDTVNELRNPMLTNIAVDALQGILIAPSTGDEILLASEKEGQELRVRNSAGKLEPLNRITLARMLAALTGTKVAEFVSDAAVNLAPYGLDRPSLKLTFVSFGSDRIELLFGQSRDGTWYAMRAGVPTVMKLADDFIAAIATRPWQWRHPSVWSIHAIDLMGIERTMEGRPPLLLEYQSLTETWKAKENGIDLSAELASNRADILLKQLLELQCSTWLAPDHPDARAALAKPALQFSLLVNTVDAEGQPAGKVVRKLLLAPASDNANNSVFYGIIDNDPQPFLVGTDTVIRLAVDLFGDE